MAKKCAVSTCDSLAASKGLCPKHYARFNTRRWLDAFTDRLTVAQADDLNVKYQKIVDDNPMLALKIKNAAERPPPRAEPQTAAPDRVPDGDLIFADPAALRARLTGHIPLLRND